MQFMRQTFALTLAGTALAFTQPLAAQSYLLPSTPVQGVWLETAHTKFREFEANLPSSVWFLSGRLPLSARLSVVADVPFSHANMDLFDEGAESNSVFGNPYIGVELQTSRRIQLELGTRAPLNTADDESFADVLAFVADPLRPEAFLENMVPVTAAATYRFTAPGALGLRARAAMTGLFHTGDESADPDAALDYSVVGTYSAGLTQTAVGFTGRWYVTSDDGDFAETSMHHATVSSDMQVGRVRPGVSLRVPLDSDYRDVVKWSLGVYLQIPLR
jgi:hypothetical protein